MSQADAPPNRDRGFLKPVPSRALCGDIEAFADFAGRELDLAVAWWIRVPAPPELRRDASRYTEAAVVRCDPAVDAPAFITPWPHLLPLKPHSVDLETAVVAAHLRDVEGVTPDEVAERLSVNRRYIRYLVDGGRLPVVRLGLRTSRFRLSDVERLLEQGGPAAPPPPEQTPS